MKTKVTQTQTKVTRKVEFAAEKPKPTGTWKKKDGPHASEVPSEMVQQEQVGVIEITPASSPESTPQKLKKTAWRRMSVESNTSIGSLSSDQNDVSDASPTTEPEGLDKFRPQLEELVEVVSTAELELRQLIFKTPGIQASDLAQIEEYRKLFQDFANLVSSKIILGEGHFDKDSEALIMKSLDEIQSYGEKVYDLIQALKAKSTDRELHKKIDEIFKYLEAKMEELTQGYEEYQKSLVTKETPTDPSYSVLLTEKSPIQTACEEMQQVQKQIAELLPMFEEKKSRVEMLDQELNRRGFQLEQLRVELTLKEREVKELEKRNDDQGKEISHLRERVKEHTNAISEIVFLKQRLEKLQEAYDRSQRDFARKERRAKKEISAKETEIKVKETEIKELHQKEKEYQEKERQKEKEYQEKERQKEKEYQEKERQKQKEYQEKERQKESEIKEKESEIKEKESEIKEKESEIKEKESAIKELHQKEKEYQEKERQRIIEKKRRLEAERKRKDEEERRKVEEERKRVEEERKRVEEERERVEEERKIVEEERRVQEEKRRLEEEERRREEEERRREEEERLAEEERIKEEERKELERISAAQDAALHPNSPLPVMPNSPYPASETQPLCDPLDQSHSQAANHTHCANYCLIM